MRKNIILFAALAAVMCFAAVNYGAERKKGDDLFKQVQLFSEGLAIIQSEYVDEIKPKDLIYGALKGMISSLDPHSQFMDPETFNELKVDTEGKFGGLGIEITIQDSLLTVVTPIEDTPAWNAGIKPGDRIVRINNDLTRDMTIMDAVKRLRGKPGEPVNLTILRESEKKILEFKIVRDIIKVKDVKDARIIEDKIGYIRVIQFSENTDDDLRSSLESLKKQGMNALILDLRNNPGGLLDTAVKVSEKFIEKGKLIVSTKGRRTNQNLELYAHEGAPILDIPIVVLINEGSASASEIVAAALQDYKRAIIVGMKSFGKGSVQTVIPLNDGSGMRLTTSRYYTPSGRMIHGKGIEPDITVEPLKVELVKKDEPTTDKTKDVFEQFEKQPKPEQPKNDYRTDSQLLRAVDILKGVRIYKQLSQK